MTPELIFYLYTTGKMCLLEGEKKKVTRKYERVKSVSYDKYRRF